MAKLTDAQKKENLELARVLDAQHPNPWTRGQWYPAEFNGQECEIKRTSGKGRNSGVNFLHVRRECKMVIVHPDGTREQTNITDYHHYRFNLRTGDGKWL